ncbi:MAG: hypothetical protein L3J71_10455 [Victivallaceae bacterium]|nr:hypothetical protein [Victivallaceae bacterium]
MKKKLSQKWVQCLLIILGTILMVSCQSDVYYKERAVNRAREYLLKNSKELSQVQREYIKYNKPVLLHKGIFSQYKPWITERYQVCVTWTVPGEEDAFLVFGTGNYHMRDWSPIRIIRKQFIEKDKQKISAMKAAVSYAMNNMLFLPDETRNYIRFSTPRFAMTNFALDKQGLLNKTDAFGKAKSAKLIAKEKATLKKQEQVSLIYTTGNEAKKVVIIGVSGAGFSGWQPVTGFEVTEVELNLHISASL